MLRNIIIVVVVAAVITAGALTWWHYRTGWPNEAGSNNGAVSGPVTDKVIVPQITDTAATVSGADSTATVTASAAASATSSSPMTILATGLEAPWSLAFLPDGSMIFTERPGRVRLLQKDGNLRKEPLLVLDDISARGESGLLGIAVHPDFKTNNFVYLYYTGSPEDRVINRVVRYTLENDALREDMVIIDNIPAAVNHDAGRIKFGPDGYLYITTGDAGNADSAQDLNSLSGKILRVRDDGAIPDDNPFDGSPVYSYGHRNPEGITWDDKGRLWATEHGSSATDELNLIEAGKNYGWPVIRGNDTRDDMVTPVINSGSDTWAPTGVAFWQGDIYFTGLRGQSLFKAEIGRNPVTLDRYLQGQFGRLRDVVVGPDGFFYILTSNRDGRGDPVREDDRIIKLDPKSLK